MSRRLVLAVRADICRALKRLLLGVKCDVCCDYYRGPRTLAAHAWADHEGEA